MAPQTAEDENLFLDIETVLDPEIEWAEYDETGKLKFQPPALHRIVCIGCYTPSEGCFAFASDDAGALLHDFAEQYRNGRYWLVIMLRALKHGIAFPRYYREKNVRYRFTPEGHLDMMDMLADFGAVRPTTLDHAAQLIRLGKFGNGAEIEELLASGGINAVLAYCLSDVFLTAALYWRFQRLTGLAWDRVNAELRELVIDASQHALLATLALPSIVTSPFVRDLDLPTMKLPAHPSAYGSLDSSQRIDPKRIPTLKVWNEKAVEAAERSAPKHPKTSCPLLRGPNGNINNCALAYGEVASECQICHGDCPDAHRFNHIEAEPLSDFPD